MEKIIEKINVASPTINDLLYHNIVNKGYGNYENNVVYHIIDLVPIYTMFKFKIIEPVSNTPIYNENSLELLNLIFKLIVEHTIVSLSAIDKVNDPYLEYIVERVDVGIVNDVSNIKIFDDPIYSYCNTTHYNDIIDIIHSIYDEILRVFNNNEEIFENLIPFYWDEGINIVKLHLMFMNDEVISEKML